MIPHPYIYEKMYASRHTEIQKDMQQLRLAAQVGQRRTFVRFTVNSLGKLLIVLGSYLQHAGQQKEASLRTS